MTEKSKEECQIQAVVYPKTGQVAKVYVIENGNVMLVDKDGNKLHINGYTRTIAVQKKDAEKFVKINKEQQW